MTENLNLDFGQLRLLTFVLVILISFGLGLALLRHIRESIPHRFFLFFLAAQTFWLIVMYISIDVSSDYRLSMARISMAFATFNALSGFLFVYTLKNGNISKKLLLILFVITILVAGIALSPFLFTHQEFNAAGELAPQAGPGILVFALFAALCELGAFYILIKEYISARGITKTHWGYLALGMILTYSLIIFFDLYYYNTSGNLNAIRLSHFYVLPFLCSASYMLLRHHFLNVRVLATELFAFLIIGISIVQLTFARNFTEFVFSLALLILLIILSILLIKSMHKEIQHRAEEAAYEELQKLDAAKSEFITIASHQLRTPLSGLKGYIAMAQEGSYGKLPTEMLRVLGNMGQATERLISLADSFLNVSRMRAGSIELNRQETDLVTFVDSVVQEMKPRAQEKDLTLNWNPPTKSMPQVPIDQEKMRTVLMGILDNAVRYTKEGSIEVKLEARNPKSEKTVTLSVKDTGKGLTPEEIKDVFTSFKRGKTAQALWTEGVGLSLYVAKQFVEAHGGRIWAESAGTEKGSAFYVNLPTV